MDTQSATAGMNVVGVSVTQDTAGVDARNSAAKGVALSATCGPGGTAGKFEGDVVVSGSITVMGDVRLTGADYAENFVCQTSGEPGNVMVIGPQGDLNPCDTEYDSKVVGIVSGAGGMRPGVILDQETSGAPIALQGKAWVKATAATRGIQCGDLLTTSGVPGHAMAADPEKLITGCVIGKALTALPSGNGPVLCFVAAL